MPEKGPARLSDTYERYALGLARAESLPPDPDAQSAESLRRGWHERLAAAGVAGWPERRTFYTGRLPPGCVPCLEGRGSNVALTTLCNRSCFFCLNPKPRQDEMSVHGEPAGAAEAPGIVRRRGAASVGISGGEPLLFVDRVLELARTLRLTLGPGVRIDVYTNGDRLTPELASRLAAAGVDGLRINLAARGYDPAPVAAAVGRVSHVAIEIPVVPQDKPRLLALVGELDRAGADHLILHELFVSAQNLDEMSRRGLSAKGGSAPDRLSWKPVAGSEEAAFEVLLLAAQTPRRLGVYYCSTGTQDWIAERALALRRRRTGKAAGRDAA